MANHISETMLIKNGLKRMTLLDKKNISLTMHHELIIY